MSDEDSTQGAITGEGKIARASREALFLGATFQVAGRPGTGRIRNISPTGALLETSEPLRVGDVITISFRGVSEARAVVKRSTPKGFGIRFEADINPSRCRLTTSSTAPPNDFILHLREEDRRQIWDQGKERFKRPGMK